MSETPIAETSWMESEIANIDKKDAAESKFPESLKFVENKITEVEIDFSKPFEKKPNKLNPGTIQVLIPVKQTGVIKTFWLNVANPLYVQILQAGLKGQKVFKILKTGTKKDTRYAIVE